MRRRRAPLDEATLEALDHASREVGPFGFSLAMILGVVACMATGHWRLACAISALSLAVLAWDMFAASGRAARVVLTVFYVALLALNVMAFAGLYREVGLLDGERKVEGFGDALYFSVITWTTVGYGDLRPSPAARPWAAAEALAGYVYMALLVGHVLNNLPRSGASAAPPAGGAGPGA